MADDLVGFLEARLDETAASAQAALEMTEANWVASASSGHPWRYSHRGVWGENEGIASTAPEVAEVHSEAVQKHIAEHDPARVLAEVAAKRRIIAELVPVVEGMDRQIEGEWCFYAGAANTLLALLATPYSAHPEYRPEWAPDA